MKQLFYQSLWVLSVIGMFGCREFYDEEFEDGSNVSLNFEDAVYTADLRSTDSSLTNMSGNATVDVEQGNVNVTIDLDGIPRNIVQVHYGYSGVDCSALSFVFPVEVGDTRTYSINEALTTDALTFDVRNSGAGERDLEGKSLIIRAYSSLSNENTLGGEVYTIACGELSLDNNPDEASTDETTDSSSDITITPVTP